ncbi:TPA: acetolactate decarboxylase [Candidatus Sumerlaeota bacterium]|jgi:acetolactate decarboxylase|nr:acetolactate decarboxylase [Candidatus Sumerlaeota bacterium]
MKKLTLLFVFAALLTLSACRTVAPVGITQVATMDALISGNYDGSLPLSQLHNYGDFGIGTFDRLDGEMILLNGVIYQVRADGKVYRPNEGIVTPLASVVHFQSEKSLTTSDALDMAGLEKAVAVAAPNQNLPCAIKVTGTFSVIKVRSVPAQTKPYPPLTEVTKTQPVFDYEQVEGTLVGFRQPPFIKGLNMPGFHLHFLSKDTQKGGHLLGFTLAPGAKIDVQVCNQFQVILPSGDNDFARLDLSKDRSADVEKAEKAPAAK